jgi:carbamoyl-phosphate synthase small subunit
MGLVIPKLQGKYAIPIIKELIEMKIPMFGICLGHQLISLALGAKTKKMFQGHRGANHPVKNLITNKVEITSQNHGFVVEEKSIPKSVLITHQSLFDGSVEGIRHKIKKYFQFSIIQKLHLVLMIVIIYLKILFHQSKII